MLPHPPNQQVSIWKNTSTKEKFISTSDLTNPPHPNTPSAQASLRHMDKNSETNMKLRIISIEITRSPANSGCYKCRCSINILPTLYSPVGHPMRVNSALDESRPESSRPGSTQPGPILPNFFIRDASMRCVLYIKFSTKDSHSGGSRGMLWVLQHPS